MAGPPNKNSSLKRTAVQRSYFFIDGRLYKKLSTERPNNLLKAWGYIENRAVVFNLTDVKQNSQQAFDTKEVAVLLNRNKEILKRHLAKGAIKRPYKIGEQEGNWGFGHLKWSEDDVLAFHEYFLTSVGIGRPRADGYVKPAINIPSRMELVAMMKQHRMYYVQDDEGNFMPVFESPDWT